MTDRRLVLVTGASGYIAKHIVAKLLRKGFAVRASARSEARFDEIRNAVRPVVAPEDLDHLSFVTLDLTDDAGWDEAVAGAEIMMHTASPFPLTQPKDENDVIKPAVDGALRAVRAAKAAGITRFIMTSSSVAISDAGSPPGVETIDESCWTDPDMPGLTPYTKSKTLAEKAVWDWVVREAPEMAVTMINPGLVLGTPLDANYGTSIDVVARLLRGTDPMLPRIGFLTVDVGDIAEMHVTAIDRAETHGQRIMGVERFLWFRDMAQMLKAAHPGRKIPTRTAPNVFIRLLSLFDPSIRTILPILNLEQRADNSRAETLLGRQLRPAPEALIETGAYVVNTIK